MNHEAWLEKKWEDKQKEEAKKAASGATEDEPPAKKTAFIHCLNFDEWKDRKKDYFTKKKQ